MDMREFFLIIPVYSTMAGFSVRIEVGRGYYKLTITGESGHPEKNFKFKSSTGH